MAQQQTQARQKTGPRQFDQPRGGQELAAVNPRIAYPLDMKERGVDEAQWRVLIDSIWPTAQSMEAVRMAVDYCRARKLDPFKRPVHIVPVYSTPLRRMVETIWPGISELRTTAVRTGTYAGCDEEVFGEDIEQEFVDPPRTDERTGEVKGGGQPLKVRFPSWCRVTVYRLVGGQRVPFPGPRVFWLEAYAKKDRFSEQPNEMWRKRPYGQLAKVAEAAALRKAFPEELGGEYAAEEMEGREIEAGVFAAEPAATTPPPPRPTRQSFQQQQRTPTVTDAVEIEEEFDLDEYAAGFHSRLAAVQAREEVLRVATEEKETIEGLPEELKAALRSAVNARLKEFPKPEDTTKAAAELPAEDEPERELAAALQEAQTTDDFAPGIPAVAETVAKPEAAVDWAARAQAMITHLSAAKTQPELQVKLRTVLMQPYTSNEMEKVAAQQAKAVADYIDELREKLPLK